MCPAAGPQSAGVSAISSAARRLEMRCHQTQTRTCCQVGAEHLQWVCSHTGRATCAFPLRISSVVGAKEEVHVCAGSAQFLELHPPCEQHAVLLHGCQAGWSDASHLLLDVLIILSSHVVGVLDPVTLEPVVNPAISPAGARHLPACAAAGTIVNAQCMLGYVAPQPCPRACVVENVRIHTKPVSFCTLVNQKVYGCSTCK